jgi:hypothetical protein
MNQAPHRRIQIAAGMGSAPPLRREPKDRGG